jgi:hypothetical protein
VDTGYTGITDMATVPDRILIPKKKTKKKPLTKEEKKNNRTISKKRTVIENVIGFIKRFRIIKDVYRCRRKRFGLRFNLIAGLCNYEIREDMKKEEYRVMMEKENMVIEKLMIENMMEVMVV